MNRVGEAPGRRRRSHTGMQQRSAKSSCAQSRRGRRFIEKLASEPIDLAALCNILVRPEAPSSRTLPTSRYQMEITRHKLTAYQIHEGDTAQIRPARRERKWMEESDQKHAYRCLPLVVANQYGWEILSTHHVRAVWNGSASPDGLRVEDLYGDGPLQCESHFGSGILTFLMPFLFRTPHGWDLLVRGPTNSPKDGIVALDGIIETDWAHSTFSMNWRFTRACTVEFVVGEPVCLFFPIQSRALEMFDCEICMLSSNPELERKYREWSVSRDRFLKGLLDGEPDVVRQGWQKDYMLASKSKKPRVGVFADRK